MRVAIRRMHIFHRPKSGRHPEKALTALQVKNLNKPGRHPDGNGLYLVVAKTGAKRWILRTVVNGRRRDIGLGGLSVVSLAEAREKATLLRGQARAGVDPLAERRRLKESSLNFREAAERVHSEHKAAWRNEKHSQQWINTLKQYAMPLLGDLAIDKIGAPEIMRVLSPIWLTKPETARRVKQRMNTVFDWAKASGYRSGDNPVDGVSKGLAKQSDKDVHHTALPYKDLPAFMTRLQARAEDEMSALALEFLILTAARTGEVLGALRSEIDLDEAVWTVPAERMKAKTMHRVPLSVAAISVLARANEKSGIAAHVFPAKSARTADVVQSEAPLSNMALLMLLRRMKVTATVHGFRSSFRDWVAETTLYSGELAEMALAHTIKNKVEAAYRRGDLLEQRRVMMQEWSDYLTSQR